MNNEKNKKLLKNVTVLCTALFIVSISTSPSMMPDAFATCGTAQKYATLGKEPATNHGVEGKVKVKSVSICGTTNNESYAHAEISMFTSGNDFIESGIWKGYGAGEQSGSDLAYNWIRENNALFGPGYTFTDVTDDENKHPDIDDVVKFTVFYDYTSFGRDYYKILIDNETKNENIEIADLWVNGKGTGPNTHNEILNEDTTIKAHMDILKEMSTSGTWSAWDDMLPLDDPSGSSNPLCYDKTDDDTIKFGIDSGSTCSTS